MKHSLFLALAIALIGISGCTSTHYVTPWLRTTEHRPFEIMAESGGPKGWAKTEIELRGEWQVVSHSARAVAIPDDNRVLFFADHGPAVVGPTGETHPIACPDKLRIDSMRRRLVCVEIEGWVADPSEDEKVVVTTFDYRGNPQSRLDSAIAGGTLPRSYFPHFPGFLADGTPVLSVHVSAVHETSAASQSKLCVAFAIGSSVTRLASLESASWFDCDQAEFWNHQTSLRIVGGQAL